MINIKKGVVLLPLLFYAWIALPLVYLADLSVTTKALRFTLLVAVAIVALSFHATRQVFWNNIQKLPYHSKVLWGVILLSVTLTSLYALWYQNLILLNAPPEYLGLVTWIVFIILGLVFKNKVGNLLFSPVTLYIFGFALVLSLLYSIFYIRLGARVAGVMLQPTTMAMYASIAAILSLQQLRISKKSLQKSVSVFILLLSVATVILCQSRVGTTALIVSLLIWLFHAGRQSKKIRLGLLILISLTVVLHIISPSYFSRFRSQSVYRGVVYRLDLYKTSAKDLVEHNVIVGNGPATLPMAINNTDLVPENIALSLNLGFNFSSTHDLFFDFAYYFGLLGALSLVTLSIYAVLYYFRNANSFNLAYLLIFMVLLANAFLNVPSLELTSMYFVVLFGLLANGFTAKNTARLKLVHET